MGMFYFTSNKYERNVGRIYQNIFPFYVKNNVALFFLYHLQVYEENTVNIMSATTFICQQIQQEACKMEQWETIISLQKSLSAKEKENTFLKTQIQISGSKNIEQVR